MSGDLFGLIQVRPQIVTGNPALRYLLNRRDVFGWDAFSLIEPMPDMRLGQLRPRQNLLALPSEGGLATCYLYRFLQGCLCIHRANLQTCLQPRQQIFLCGALTETFV